MNSPTREQKAHTLLALHRADDLLVLPNVWNPIGARVLQAQHYPAVATASAAIAESLAYRDGEKIALATLIDMIGRIARSVDVPVTADIEKGFAQSRSELMETIEQVIDAGVVGINLEDSLNSGGELRAIDEQSERLACCRSVASSMGVDLVINARIDAYVTDSVAASQKLDVTIARAKNYIEAGADCIYPIGPNDKKTVTQLCERIDAPVNILAGPKAESLPVLKSAGARRVSFGPFIFRACLKRFADISTELQSGNDYDCITTNTMSGADVQPWLIEGSEDF